jgi:cell division protein FtsB
MDKSLE